MSLTDLTAEFSTGSLSLTWWYAFLTAAVLGGAAFLLSLVDIGPNSDRRAFVQHSVSGQDVFAGIVTFVVTLLVNAMFYAWSPPVFTGAGTAIWAIVNLSIVALITAFFDYVEGDAHGVGRDQPAISTVACVAMIIVIFIQLFVWNSGPLFNGNAKKLAGLLDVTVVDEAEQTKNYPKTDINHLVTVAPQNALKSAQEVMNSPAISGRFDLGVGRILDIGGHFYYVYPLSFQTLGKAKDANHLVPGYIQVDAENPEAKAKYVPTSPIKYYIGGRDEHSIDRLIWHAFPGYFVDGLKFDVRDDGKPFYTGTLNTPEVRWQKSIPRLVLTVDAETGEVMTYELAETPPWVDRVISEDTARTMLDWWGHYNFADWNLVWETNTGRYNVNGDINPVYTEEGPAWQALMSAWGNGDVVHYIAHINARTGKTTIYRAPNGLMTEDRVFEIFLQNPDSNKKQDPSGLTLHKIYGRLVWVAGMVGDGLAVKDDEGEPVSAGFAGVGMLDATNSEPTQVVVMDTKEAALNELLGKFAQGGRNTDPNAEGEEKSLEGIITEYSEMMLGGNTYANFQLDNDPAHIYRVQITGDPASVRLTWVEVGAKVVVRFLDTSGEIRNVSSVDVIAPAPVPVPQPTGGG